VDSIDRNRTIIDSSFRFPKAVALALGLGLAFGGGLVAGGVADTRVDPPAPEPEDPVARAEARTRAYDALVKNQPLTWHHELTAPDPKMPAPPPAAKTAPSASSTTASADDVAAAGAHGTAPTTGHGSATTPTKPAAPAPTAEQATEPPLLDRALRAETEPEPAPAPRRNDVDEARGANVDRDDEDGGEIVRPDPRKLDEAFARVAGNTTPTTSTKRYAIQLASVPNADDARAVVEAWKKKGVKAAIVPAEVAGKGTMYRVRISGLASKEDATRRKAELNDGIIVAEDSNSPSR
jgi:cell division septation protein DedD